MWEDLSRSLGRQLLSFGVLHFSEDLPGHNLVGLMVCEFCEVLCACAQAGAESGAGQLQVQFQEQVTKFSIR